MNRAIFHRRADATMARANPLYRRAKQLSLETESMLRDIGYVLELTRRVKEQLLEEQEGVAAGAARLN